ncbi:hypothetical protein [Romboutsia lituseburensis]|uniref:Uncharacterized protein n=1 Tax=Romboutsia lituseburensis DSM 797 TaxID=1121325 RepID=A0A1G9L2R7_9FIRM|nr:hypothetical protein [Romboutsia lituseburensis]CEH35130.1 Hypothetical protein RLITU_2552 [Romboutsia lituseburensis]SDL56252.1 hypothetical protein SAMN04515677_102367 [Romboutsia lituseburensis DSM 797]
MESVLSFLENFFKYSTLWMILCLICTILYLDTKKNKNEGKEKYVLLKIIGFCILGFINIKINTKPTIIIPIGFIIYYLFINKKIKRNYKIKKNACILGVLVIYLGSLNSYIYKELEYRDKSIIVQTLNLKDLRKQWEDAREKLNIDIGNEVLANMEITSDRNGNIKNMSWETYDDVNNNKYEVEYNKNKKSINKLNFKVTEVENNLKNKNSDIIPNNEHKISMFEMIDKINAIQFNDMISSDCIEYKIKYKKKFKNEEYNKNNKNYYISSYDEEKYAYNLELGQKIHFPMKGNIITLSDTNSKNKELINIFIDRNEYVDNQIESIEKLNLSIENNQNSKKSTSTLHIEKDNYLLNQVVNALDYYTWEEVNKDELKGKNNLKNSIIISSGLDVNLKIYEDYEFIHYKYNNDEIIYKCNKDIYSDIKSLLKK